MKLLFQTMTILAMAPLVIFPPIVMLALLTGAIRPAGLWSHDANATQISPARVMQFIFGLGAVAAALIGLAQSGGTAFAPLPQWLFIAAGGGNILYLGAKWNASRRNGDGDKTQ
jgi:hypothetical protein